MSVQQIGTTGNSTALVIPEIGAAFPTNLVIIGAVMGAFIVPIMTGKASKTQIPIGALIGAIVGYLIGRK